MATNSETSFQKKMLVHLLLQWNWFYLINAKENLDVAIIDILNAFVKTVVKGPKDREIIHIHRLMVDMLMKIAPDMNEDYVTIDKKVNQQFLMECFNALDGIMVASLLYYQKFTKSLKEQGYTMNPYDPCVWNKMINGKQLIICFHVDDCKVLLVSPKVVNETVDWLCYNYEFIFKDGSSKMRVRQGKVHDYLGMTLDFSKKHQVKMSMFKYVDEMITPWGKIQDVNIKDDGFRCVKFKRHVTSMARENLFKINEDAVKLDDEDRASFHNLVTDYM